MHETLNEAQQQPNYNMACDEVRLLKSTYAGGDSTTNVAEAVSSDEEAIEYVKEHPVDLIALHMVMPEGTNGRETYEEIIKIRPGQKAIIASGYAKTKEVDHAQELGEIKKKPCALAKVGVAVKEEPEKQAVFHHQLDFPWI